MYLFTQQLHVDNISDQSSCSPLLPSTPLFDDIHQWELISPTSCCRKRSKYVDIGRGYIRSGLRTWRKKKTTKRVSFGSEGLLILKVKSFHFYNPCFFSFSHCNLLGAISFSVCCVSRRFVGGFRNYSNTLFYQGLKKNRRQHCELQIFHVLEAVFLDVIIILILLLFLTCYV